MGKIKKRKLLFFKLFEINFKISANLIGTYYNFSKYNEHKIIKFKK